MFKKIVLSLFLICSGHLMAQDREYSFTLEEAIEFAIDSSYTTINARRDIAIAIKQKWEAISSGLPQINADVSYQNLLKQPVTLIPGEITGGEPGSFVPVVFGTEQNANLVATLDQLIFDGSYLVGLQAAEAFLDFSENAAEKAGLEVRRGVINAYGSVLLAEEIIDIFERNKTNLEKNLFETRKTFENGLAEEEDVEQLEITLLDITTQLMIGLGVSAISDSWYGFAQNVKGVEEYQSLVTEGILPVHRGHILSDEDLVIRRHILNLMCRFETSWDEQELNFGELDNVLDRLKEIEADGLLELGQEKLRVRKEGQAFIRNICMAFDLRLQRSKPETQLFSMTI